MVLLPTRLPFHIIFLCQNSHETVDILKISKFTPLKKLSVLGIHLKTYHFNNDFFIHKSVCSNLGCTKVYIAYEPTLKKSVGVYIAYKPPLVKSLGVYITYKPPLVKSIGVHIAYKPPMVKSLGVHIAYKPPLVKSLGCILRISHLW